MVDSTARMPILPQVAEDSCPGNRPQGVDEFGMPILPQGVEDSCSGNRPQGADESASLILQHPVEDFKPSLPTIEEIESELEK